MRRKKLMTVIPHQSFPKIVTVCHHYYTMFLFNSLTSWLMQFPPLIFLLLGKTFLAESYCYCTFNSFYHAHSNTPQMQVLLYDSNTGGANRFIINYYTFSLYIDYRFFIHIVRYLEVSILKLYLNWFSKCNMIYENIL